MNSLVLALLVVIGFLIAYNTYGKFLGNKIFKLVADNACPSHTLQDNKDFVPTNKHVLFGHHFTSIAGLGPIVGPAIAVIWGWVPAVLWVIFGSIFIGAVHDFGALIVSLRHQGRSIGDISGDLINKRVRLLFLLVIFFLLLIIIAVFALIIAILFNMYPQAVIPVWFEVPIAIWLGHMIYKKGASHTTLGIIAVVIMYVTVFIGANFPIDLKAFGLTGSQALITWMIILYIYAFIASRLPVQTLLQPRDYINSHQLFVAFILLFLGLFVAHPQIVAPAYNASPAGAPAIFPMIFVIIACGAISGFHSIVSSGTSSKQCDTEKDAKFIGYGSMLTEAILSLLVIIACTAGIGMGLTTKTGEVFMGAAAFSHQYSSWAAASGLGAKLSAFINGSANMVESYGLPHNITITIMGVFIVSFAATTLDTATRLQRYIVGELGNSLNMPKLNNPTTATSIAVITAFILSFYNGSGKGALTLWPLFGTANQLLGGLALLVITVYLVKQKKPAFVTAIPMVFMIFITTWAMLIGIRNFYLKQNMLLLTISIIIFILEVWMVLETIIFFKKAKKE